MLIPVVLGLHHRRRAARHPLNRLQAHRLARLDETDAVGLPWRQTPRVLVRDKTDPLIVPHRRRAAFLLRFLGVGLCRRHSAKASAFRKGEKMNEARCIAYRDDGAICREPVPTEAELACCEGKRCEPAPALLECIRKGREAALKSRQRAKRPVRRRRTAR